MNKLLAAALAVAVAGCTTGPYTSVGKPEYSPIGYPVEPLAYVRKRCKQYAASITSTQYALYGKYGDYVGVIDDTKACFERHGYRVAWRQPNGMLTSYPAYDSRLDY